MTHQRHITLHGGPHHLNRKIIPDLGTVEIKFPVRRNHPTLNSGLAIYEPHPTRQIAHFREIIWDGKNLPISSK